MIKFYQCLYYKFEAFKWFFVGPTEVSAISLKEGFDECQTLISDNGLFKKVIHYDGRNGFTIDVWKQPKTFTDKKRRQLFCLENDPLNIWQHSGEFGAIPEPDKRLKGGDGEILGSPYKVSFVVDMIRMCYNIRGTYEGTLWK